MSTRFIIGDRILLTLWVGGLWITGYVVAPLLFNTLDDRQLAGSIAGEIFSVMSFLGLACGSLLLLSTFIRAGKKAFRLWTAWVIFAMLVITIIGEFYLQPMMSELRASGLIENSAEAARFGMLHGIAQSLFLVMSLSGLALVIAGTDRTE